MAYNCISLYICLLFLLLKVISSFCFCITSTANWYCGFKIYLWMFVYVFEIVSDFAFCCTLPVSFQCFHYNFYFTMWWFRRWKRYTTKTGSKKNARLQCVFVFFAALFWMFHTILPLNEFNALCRNATNEISYKIRCSSNAYLPDVNIVWYVLRKMMFVCCVDQSKKFENKNPTAGWHW